MPSMPRSSTYLGVSDHNGDGGPDIDYVRWVEHQMCDVLMLPRKIRADLRL